MTDQHGGPRAADSASVIEPPKSRRPLDSPFLQQRLRSWEPVLTPMTSFIILFVIGICFLPTGSYLLTSSDAIYEKIITYDGSKTNVDCKITTSGQGRTCQIPFTFTEDVDGPIYVFYQLTGYYQNHRQYVQSIDYLQLSAESNLCSTLIDSADVKVKNGTNNLNPCGLVANSYFNDVFSVNSGLSKAGVTMDEAGISWKSDRTYNFIQPSGFTSKANPTNAVCDTLLGKIGSKSYTDAASVNYCFWYPNDDTTQYLYETYPQISPLKGVTDEHFIVWMRTASTPTFRKLYGEIKGKYKKGETITFDVTANFLVNNIGVSKSLILSTQGDYGNKNPGLGIVYLVVGAICMSACFLFAFKHYVMPRPWGTALIEEWAAEERRKNAILSVGDSQRQ